MKTILALLVVVVTVGSVHAQPGQTPPTPAPAPYPPAPAPQPYPPAPQPYGQPCPPPGCAPMPYAYQPVALSGEDQDLLARGEISDGQMVAGGLVAIFFGFGIGQALEGRFGDTGWIFLLGEGASYGALVAGLVDTLGDCLASDTSCHHSSGTGLLVAGMVGFVVFHIWGAVDAFTGPQAHNRRVRELRMRLGMPPQFNYSKIQPYVHHGDGATAAGFAWHF